MSSRGGQAVLLGRYDKYEYRTRSSISNICILGRVLDPSTQIHEKNDVFVVFVAVTRSRLGAQLVISSFSRALVGI